MKTYKNMRNPILPVECHIPDGEAHVMSDGRLYIYGSFDNRDDYYCSNEYHVVSTSDMENWCFHDTSLKAEEIPWFFDPDAPKYPGIDWSNPTPFIRKMMKDAEKEGDCINLAGSDEKIPVPLLYAPDCIEKDGKYYLYFCMSDDSEGVAVSDKPEGPFKDPVQLPCGGIDPAIFIDDDGQAYYYWGQLFSHGVKLNADMCSFDPETAVHNLVTEEKHFFHEGSSMRKIGDTYYYVYANMERGKPTSLGYSTGKTPFGPFEYQGIIVDNDGCDPVSWNNHGSIECLNGQWYVFYHRCSRKREQYRKLCIEKIYVNPDGTIDEVKMTSQGVGEPFAPGEAILGYQACSLKGETYIDVDDAFGYGEKLTSLADGDEIIFRYVKSESGWTKANMTCAGSGNVKILLHDEEIGSMQVEGEKGKLQKVETAVSGPAGEYELKLVIENSEALEILEITLE